MIAGKRTAAERHQEPLEEANRLAGVFAGRTSSENLPQQLGACKSASTRDDGKG